MLLIDMPNLCLREAHAKAGLNYKGRPSGVVYGALQQLRNLMRRFPGEVCCCWDSPRSNSLRKAFYPEYKANRDGKDLPEAVSDAYPQMTMLRAEILPRLGLPNQFVQNGYEADDLIAYLAYNSWQRVNGDKMVIISSDNDLFQLLGPRVSIYNIGRKASMGYTDFRREFGVSPMQWIEVKALAGDDGDNIEGIAGVGVKTAVKIVLGRPVSRKIQQEVSAFCSMGHLERNRKLIKLPWEGTDPGSIQQSQFDEREFMRVCAEWGLRNIE
jgi:5'-3' exonuclease